MLTLTKLDVTDNRIIEILSENEGGNISPFDEIKVIYHLGVEQFILFNDFICEGITALQNILEKALSGELEIDEKYFERGIGYEWNKISNAIADGDFDIIDTTIKYSLWSTSDEYSTSTWMYSFNGDVYIEISPQYKWNYCDPDEDERYMPFQDFQLNYRTYDRVKVVRDQLTAWKMEVKKISKKIK